MTEELNADTLRHWNLKSDKRIMQFWEIMAEYITASVFYDVTPCTFINSHYGFGGSCCLAILEERKWRHLSKKLHSVMLVNQMAF